MPSGFQQQWFAVMILAASGFAVYHGMRIALRREIDNPLVQLRGDRALLVGIAIAAVGVAGVALGLLEGIRAYR